MKGITLLGFIAFLISCLNNAHSYQKLTNLLNQPIYDLHGFIEEQNQKEKAQSIELTLVALKESEPNFFNDYVLMYNSRSLQTSSFMYPRVLLNSKNSTTIISYNGDPEDHGYDKLEVMRFDPQTTKFTFNEISYIDGKLKLSNDNPQKCMRCHQRTSRAENDPRPNWEPYSIWPGAYSSLSVGGDDLKNPKSPRYDLVVYKNSELENEKYDEFLNKIVPTHDRYKLLTPMVMNKWGEYFPALGVPDDSPNKFTTTMTDQLLTLNALRMARLISGTKIMEDYKLVVYALASCQKLYLPDEIFDWHRKYIHHDIQENFALEEFGDAIELIFEPYNISTQDWSMDFGTGAKFAFRHRFGGPRDFRSTFKEALKLKMPELGIARCTELKNKIKENSFSRTNHYRNQVDIKAVEGYVVKPLISRCVSCHTSSAFGAPYIPFDNEEELSLALKTNGYPRGTLKEEILYRIGAHAQFFERMPADGYIPRKEELEELENYIKGL